MLSEQPVLGTCGMIACAYYLTTQADVWIPGYFAAPGVPLQHALLVHCVVVEGPWEDGKGHAQANTSNPQTHIFEVLPTHAVLVSRWIGSLHFVMYFVTRKTCGQRTLCRKDEVNDNSTISSWNNSRRYPRALP